MEPIFFLFYQFMHMNCIVFKNIYEFIKKLTLCTGCTVEGLCLDNNRRSEVEKSHMEMGKMEMSFFCTPQ